MSDLTDPASLAAMRADTQRHLLNGTGCSSCARNVLALLDETERLRAVVARVGAMADCWDREAATLGRSLSNLMLRDSARQVRTVLAARNETETERDQEEQP